MADAPDLYALAGEISREFEAAGIQHAISGSIAMAAHGYLRGTHDVDLLVVTSALKIPRAFEIVRSHGFEGEDSVLIRELRERGVATLRRGTWAVEILAPVIPYHHTLIDRAVRLDVAGRTVPYVSVEDLVVLKLLWHRPKDLADLAPLVAVRYPKLDLEYVRTTLDSVLPDATPESAEIERVVRDVAARMSSGRQPGR